MSKFGLNKKLWDYVNGNMAIEMQTELYWIMEYIRQKLYYVQENDDIVEKLCIVGFNRDKAEELECQFRENEFFSHQSLLYWIENYLEKAVSF